MPIYEAPYKLRKKFKAHRTCDNLFSDTTTPPSLSVCQGGPPKTEPIIFVLPTYLPLAS